MIYRKMESFLHIESISEIYLINVFVKRIKSTASLRGSIPNNYSAVYQKELALILIQAIRHAVENGIYVNLSVHSEGMGRDFGRI